MQKARCLICGEELSAFDTKHVKTKHPEYYHASRKWTYSLYVSALLMGIFGIFGVSQNPPVRDAMIVLVIVDLAVILYIFSKWTRLASKYRGF